MVRELKVLHKNPEASYVEEGFSGISNKANKNVKYILVA